MKLEACNDKYPPKKDYKKALSPSEEIGVILS
jgi:hypothetical protein